MLYSYPSSYITLSLILLLTLLSVAHLILDRPCWIAP